MKFSSITEYSPSSGAVFTIVVKPPDKGSFVCTVKVFGVFDMVFGRNVLTWLTKGGLVTDSYSGSKLPY